MPTAPATKSAGPATVIPVEKDFEFSDMSAMTCLLCARKFKSQDQLDRHNKESDLHKARAKLLQCLFSSFTDDSSLLWAPLFGTYTEKRSGFQSMRCRPTESGGQEERECRHRSTEVS